MTELHTERLRLRAIGPDDLAIVVRIQTDPELRHHLDDGRPRTLPECEDALEHSLAHWREHCCGDFVAELHDRRLAGMVGFNTPTFLPEEMPVRDVGWTIVQEHQRRGYATEAGSALVDWFFAERLGPRLVAIHNTDNPRSGAVMARLGMRWLRQRRHPDYGFPIEIWETTLAQWETRTPAR